MKVIELIDKRKMIENMNKYDYYNYIKNDLMPIVIDVDGDEYFIYELFWSIKNMEKCAKDLVEKFPDIKFLCSSKSSWYAFSILYTSIKFDNKIRDIKISRGQYKIVVDD